MRRTLGVVVRVHTGESRDRVGGGAVAAVFFIAGVTVMFLAWGAARDRP
jgi:hypothetical protein